MIVSIICLGNKMNSKEAFSNSFKKELVLKTIHTEIRKYLDTNYGIIINPDNLEVKFLTEDIISKEIVVCFHGFEVFSSQLQENIKTILNKPLKYYASVPISYHI